MNNEVISTGTAKAIIAPRTKKGRFSESQVRRLCKSMKIDAHKDGKTWFISKDSVLKYVEKLNGDKKQ